MLSRFTGVAIVLALLWIAWCVLVMTELVPAIQRHVTMWGWLLAYLLCLMPVIAVAVGYLLRTRRPS